MFEDAVGTLLEFSFIKEENVGEVFAMHRLVQLATRKWLELYQRTEDYKEKAVSVLSDHYPDGNYENWNRCELLEPHAQIIFGYKYSSQRFRLQQALVLHNGTWYASVRGGYEVANDRIDAAVKIRKEYLDTDSLDIMNSLDEVLPGHDQTVAHLFHAPRSGRALRHPCTHHRRCAGLCKTINIKCVILRLIQKLQLSLYAFLLFLLRLDLQ